MWPKISHDRYWKHYDFLRFLMRFCGQTNCHLYLSSRKSRSPVPHSRSPSPSSAHHHHHLEQLAMERQAIREKEEVKYRVGQKSRPIRTANYSPNGVTTPNYTRAINRAENQMGSDFWPTLYTNRTKISRTCVKLRASYDVRWLAKYKSSKKNCKSLLNAGAIIDNQRGAFTLKTFALRAFF